MTEEEYQPDKAMGAIFDAFELGQKSGGIPFPKGDKVGDVFIVAPNLINGKMLSPVKYYKWSGEEWINFEPGDGGNIYTFHHEENVEDKDKFTIKTNFGLGNNPETEITFYKCLRENERLEGLIQYIDSAKSTVNEMMMRDERCREALLECMRTLNKLKRDLQIQYDGRISY